MYGNADPADGCDELDGKKVAGEEVAEGVDEEEKGLYIVLLVAGLEELCAEISGGGEDGHVRFDDQVGGDAAVGLHRHQEDVLAGVCQSSLEERVQFIAGKETGCVATKRKEQQDGVFPDSAI